MKNIIRYKHSAAQFAVKNVAESTDFYKDILGFKIDYLSGSPLTYAVVYRDQVYIHLCKQEVLDYTIGAGCVFISVSAVDLVWQNLQDKDVEIIETIADRDYGSAVHFRTFSLYDPDKNVLRIGEKI